MGFLLMEATYSQWRLKGGAEVHRTLRHDQRDLPLAGIQKNVTVKIVVGSHMLWQSIK